MSVPVKTRKGRLLSLAPWLLAAAIPALGDELQEFTLEGLNDAQFSTYPPPEPIDRERYEYDITSSFHEEFILERSTRLRNLSVKLENRGRGLIRSPYLYGPHGWDFRSLEAIADLATSDPGLTREEKFVRLHEWKGFHVVTVLGGSYAPYVDSEFSSNPLRVLNQYGTGMCGQSTLCLNSLLRVVPPIGSMYGRTAKLESHRTGEAYWDGRWHTFDSTPGTGVVQWVYYDDDNETIAPTWKYLIQNPELVSRIRTYTSATTDRYLDDATGETFNQNRAMRAWDFNYDLRPDESITMHFGMRGRLDRTSARQDNSQVYRCYSDYGSAVFSYSPDLTNGDYKEFGARQKNVRYDSDGLQPIDPDDPSEVIFEMKSTWCFAGANIKAWFKTDGDVYVGVDSDPYETNYSSGVSWQKLSSNVKEYSSASIEGKMAYWLKFTFEGEGSGLSAVQIDSEVQMSPWSMPGLEYGLNRIVFEAEDMNSSRLHVTFEYDDRSPFHLYEPAGSEYGRHIPIRIGGILQRGAKISTFDHGKGRFWDRLNTDPWRQYSVKVEIYKISGDGAGTRVRTLVNRRLTAGFYKFYWDGRDTNGYRLPRGMYAYKLTIDGKLIYGERLYLYDHIWPVPNERRDDVGELGLRIIVNPESPAITQTVRFTAEGRPCEGGESACFWDLGDGTTIRGVGAVHAYSAPGAYTVQAQARDTAGRMAQGRAVIYVHEDALPLDRSPMPSPIEDVGPSPIEDAAADSGPEGSGDDPGLVETLPLVVKKMAGNVRFDALRDNARCAPDHVFLKVVLPGLPSGWDPAGKAVRVNIGGVEAEFLLDRNGRGRGPAGQVRLQLRRKRGEFMGGDAIARIALRGNWANEWVDEGIDPGEDEKGAPFDLTVGIQLEELSYGSKVRQNLTSRAHRAARFILAE